MEFYFVVFLYMQVGPPTPLIFPQAMSKDDCDRLVEQLPDVAMQEFSPSPPYISGRCLNATTAQNQGLLPRPTKLLP